MFILDKNILKIIINTLTVKRLIRAYRLQFSSSIIRLNTILYVDSYLFTLGEMVTSLMYDMEGGGIWFMFHFEILAS